MENTGLTTTNWITVIAITIPILTSIFYGILRLTRRDEHKDMIIKNLVSRTEKLEGKMEILSADLLDVLHSTDKRLALIESKTFEATAHKEYFRGE